MRIEDAKSSSTLDHSRLVVLNTSRRPQLLEGRLGDLGIIDEKYDVAISTACPQLHHMSLRHRAAQSAISTLKNSTWAAARVSFLTNCAERPHGADGEEVRLTEGVRGYSTL